MRGFWIGLVVVVAGFALVGVSVYNGIVSAHEKIRAQWAQVESQLQRRSDLIPNLVESTKGYMGHEKDVFKYVADARAKLAQGSSIPEKIQAASGLDAALARLLAIAENYPELKSDRTFIQLMDELSGTENRIAVERMRYNEAVRVYNTNLRRFPGNMFARTFKFELASEYYGAKPGAEAAPAIKF